MNDQDQIAHNLRTPLSVIRWHTEMLLAGDFGALSPEQEQKILHLNTASLEMLEKINETLLFLKSKGI